MTPERLASLRSWGVSFDLETHKIQRGLAAPPLVCGSVAQSLEAGISGALLDKEAALELALKLLGDDRYTLVVQNGAFDLLVVAVYAARARSLDLMPAIFAAYQAGRIFDIGLAEQLHAIARGHLRIDPRTGQDLMDPLTGERSVGYRLSVLVDLVLNRKDAKVNDVWRESYALLEPYPIESWPVEARQYPVDDACNTLEVALAQAGHLPSITAHEYTAGGGACRRCGLTQSQVQERHRVAGAGGSPLCSATAPHLNLHDLSRQTFAAWALHLGAAWGFMVDPAAVAALEATTHLVDPVTGNLTERGRHRQRFIEAGILRDDGTEDQAFLKRMVALAYGCTGHHEPCRGTGKVVTKWAVRPDNCPHAADLKAKGLGTKDCTICPRRPLATKQCVECSATGLDVLSAPVPMTEASATWPNGQVQFGRDALAETGDELLMDYAHFTEEKKIGGTYVPWLKEGIDPGTGRAIPLTLRPNPLLETGRVSYLGVVQLLPRGGGVRDCIVARPGRLFSSVDYEAGELITHGQSCIWLVGQSKLAEALVAGVKPHNALAATILNISYEEFNKRFKAGDRQAKDTRQASKPANFGFPGRMGPVKLVQQQRKQGPDTPHPSGPTLVKDGGKLVPGYKGLRFCLLMGYADKCGEPKVTEWKRRTIAPTCRACILAATSLREGWLRQWPENESYFEHIQWLEESGQPAVQHVSKRLRLPGPREGGAGNSLANGYFQALLADAAKDALCQVVQECYVRNEENPSLYGSRAILLAHDEDITEHPESIAAEGALRVADIMVSHLKRYCPDLAPAVRAEPALMRSWLKSAEPRFDSTGRLIPWEPKAKAAAQKVAA